MNTLTPDLLSVKYVATPNRTAFSTVITTREAHAAGITQNMLYGRRSARVCRAVYAKEPDQALRTRAEAALAAAGPGSRLCGATVLELLGVPVPRQAKIHVLSTREERSRRRPGIQIHRPCLPVVAVDVAGLPGVHPVQCWLQGAGTWSMDQLIVAADGLLRRKHPVSTLDEMTGFIRDWKGRPGAERARRALADARAGTDSPMETRTRLLLVRAGLPCPLVNLEILDEFGRSMYFLDMSYPEVQIGVEYDGAIHGEVDEMRHDRTRRRWLEDTGWRVITVTTADLDSDPNGVVESVRRALTVRAKVPDSQRPANGSLVKTADGTLAWRAASRRDAFVG